MLNGNGRRTLSPQRGEGNRRSLPTALERIGRRHISLKPELAPPMLLVSPLIMSRRALMLGTGAAALQRVFAIGRSFAATDQKTRLTAKAP
ncbi:MAG TPA: hypothetical protein VIM52_01705 [Stellaceae bacterium]